VFNGTYSIDVFFSCCQVKINDSKYNDVRVSYLYSSIMIAPRAYCDPSEYFYNDDLAQKTIDAHIYINQHERNGSHEKGCSDRSATFHENTRAYVLISQPIERVWRRRPAELTKDIIWTYVGMRTGVFRTYPAHRSVRDYDHTSRAWYKRAVSFQDRTTASMPYLDLSGGGKVITIAQALFEGETYGFN
jgi:voltage-dependent calcium channel alpha-2/delta-3